MNHHQLNYNILRYGMMKRLKGGVRISINTTWKCNLNCDYCISQAAGGKPLRNPEMISAGAWSKIIKNFPTKVREVVFSGGEPTLYPGFIELVCWLIFNGYFVTINSNLREPSFLHALPPSPRLHFIVTYHVSGWTNGDGGYAPETFHKLANNLRRWYRVSIVELETKAFNRCLKSRTVEKLRCNECNGKSLHCPTNEVRYCDRYRFIFAPDGKMYLNIIEMLRAYNDQQ